ncbi:uncharacterized protein LOC119499835 [Sebastes umbrosus]|uniref:uncharacterized protein LOC119499835 n=1 Tax=Sebastes umbrosus TaxID=72105 RepID=UPI00189F2DB7|nr:uncharacterized protein LOC119499835 [Sebastes umbrosus]
MTHFGHNLPQKMFELITTAVSTLLLLVIFYILQYIFDMDFVCSCTTVTGKNIHPNGVLYLLVPPLILICVVTLIESFHKRRIFTRWQRHFQNNGCCFFVKLVISYVSLTAVWVATVMFDGDWYFCLMTNRNVSLTGIPCKDELSYEENLIKNAYKSTSLEYGFYIIGPLIVVWSFVELCCGRHKTWRCCPKRELPSSPPYYKMVYEDLLAEQVSSHLQDELTNIATERAKVICTPYLLAIKDNEQSFNRTCDSNDSVDDVVSEAWGKISASDFYLIEPERQEDSHEDMLAMFLTSVGF